jgi:hypothetical protein
VREDRLAGARLLPDVQPLSSRGRNTPAQSGVGNTWFLDDKEFKKELLAQMR